MKDYFTNETETMSWTKGIKPTLVQIARWKWMKDNILNPIREHVGQPVYITDCLRSKESYERLIKHGYFPSSTSDHFAGTPIPVTRQKDIERYGDIFTYSTFATDIDGEFDHKKLCRDLLLTINKSVASTDPHFVHGLSEFGVEQIILEEQDKDGRKITWIHISAPLEAFWSPNEAKIIRAIRAKSRYLIGVNGIYSETKFI